MKTILLTWLLFIPIQIYASTLDASTIQSADTELTSSTVTLNSENAETITLAHQRDIQKLKSQLAYKNHELFNHEMDQWKHQASTLIFFVGMLIFAFLYIKNKMNLSDSKSYTLSSLHTQEK